MNTSATGLLTPEHQHNDVTNVLRSIQEPPEDEPSRKKQRFVHLTTDQFTILLQCYEKQQQDITSLLRLHTPPSGPSISNTPLSVPNTRPQDYYNNVKFEDLACRPITPAYDGSASQLIPFMNKLHLRRQNELWATSTYFTINNKTYDLLRDFTSLDETDIKAAATTRWTAPTVQHDKTSFNHTTYNARCLAQVLLSSLTDDFSLTLTNRIDTILQHDGPYVLWMIGHNIHRSNVAFTESIKTTIRALTLQGCNEDTVKYLETITQNLRLITGPTKPDDNHIDLLPHIFLQLCRVTVTPFKDAALQWHLQYLEGKSPTLTPIKLIALADDKIRLLQHAQQWKEDPPSSVMALKAQVLKTEATTTECIQQLTAHLTNLTKAYQQGRSPFNKQTPYPDWMITPPTAPNDTIRNANNRQYTWCTRCRRGEGLWVSTHQTSTHQDNFKRQRRQGFHSTPTNGSRYALQQIPAQPAHPPPYPQAPPINQHKAAYAQTTITPAVQLSLDDCLTNFLGQTLPAED